MKKRMSKFSRDRLTEFVNDVSKDATKIVITVTPTGDIAEISLPFEKRKIVLHGGESVYWNEKIPGSIPTRYVMSSTDCGIEIASAKKETLKEKNQATEATTWDDEDNHVKRACEHYGISDAEQRKGFLLFKTRDELFRLLYGVNAMQLQTSSKRFIATIHYDAEWEDWAITIDEYDTNQEGKV